MGSKIQQPQSQRSSKACLQISIQNLGTNLFSSKKTGGLSAYNNLLGDQVPHEWGWVKVAVGLIKGHPDSDGELLPQDKF